MKNHRDLIGLFANGLIVVAILCAIIFGLNKIGVYDLPHIFEKVVNLFGDDVHSKIDNEFDVYDSLDFKNVDNTNTEKAYLSYENARILLENVVVSSNYNQEVIVKNIDNSKEMYERFVISNRNDNFDVSVFCIHSLSHKYLYSTASFMFVKSFTR